MGLSASGKSTLAKAWADRHHYSYFNSDVVRKQLAGVSETSAQQASWGEGIYTPQMSRRTYDALLTYAKRELDAGKTVVLDACYGAREERERLIRFADKIKIIPYFVLCYCSKEVIRSRLAARAGDSKAVSDADLEIFKKQQENLNPLDDLESINFISINTESPIEQLLAQMDFTFEKKSPVI